MTMLETGARLSVADVTLSPVDLPDGEGGVHPLRWATTAIAAASLFLLAANATSLDDWANDLAPGLMQERVVVMTGWWKDATDSLGLGTARAWMHGLWKTAQAARFGSEQGKD
jgi:hypothetical protein